ncbi:hypothetical protein SEA_NANOSMITE_139 [Mycobacterium phage Nanosmite]|nr:hypothetical protein SEA_NANOSMITE_139 [Mycobacterium phage Nanosmite]
MTEFYTVITFANGEANSDTDVNTNSHRSVRSYKTERVAIQAILRGTQESGVTYRILCTVIEPDREVWSTWCEFFLEVP